MGGWIFAQGREAEQTLGDVVTAGAIQIALTGADGIFAVGELLFISEADGSEVEFLGGVTAVSPTAVDFALALLKSKDSGAKLWRPISSFATGGDAVLPSKRETRSGVAVERSLGGVSYAIRTAVATKTMDWSLEELTPQSEANLTDWLDQTAQGGLVALTLVAPSRALDAVRLHGPGTTQTLRAGGRASLSLSLLIEEEGGYR